jgi:hypothetical protein
MMSRKIDHDKRRTARVSVPVGVWVAWHASGERQVSRVRDLSAGGVFVSTTTPARVGAQVNLLFSLPEGEVRAQAIVRNSAPGKGMGVEFTQMEGGSREHLFELLKRLMT